jgi:hypothetical protein
MLDQLQTSCAASPIITTNKAYLLCFAFPVLVCTQGAVIKQLLNIYIYVAIHALASMPSTAAE